MDKYEEIIRKFYRENDKLLNKKADLPDLSGAVLTTNNIGLGDCLSLAFIPELSKGQTKIYSHNPFFGDLRSVIKGYNDYYFVPNNGMKIVPTEILQGRFNCGGMHYFQRIQKALGLPIQTKPKAIFDVIPNPIAKRVALNFNVGKMVAQQKLTVHPRARELYPENRTILQYFIFEKLNQGWEFFEFGTEFSGLEGVTDRTKLPILKTIQEMKDCEFYIGLHSGLMHVAAALDLKGIIIINFPDANLLVLPSLKDYKIPDLDWCEPQFCYLHQDSSSVLIPEYSRENLDKALNGEVYPFFSDKYLGLIHESN